MVDQFPRYRIVANCIALNFAVCSLLLGLSVADVRILMSSSFVCLENASLIRIIQVLHEEISRFNWNSWPHPQDPGRRHCVGEHGSATMPRPADLLIRAGLLRPVLRSDTLKPSGIDRNTNTLGQATETLHMSYPVRC